MSEPELDEASLFESLRGLDVASVDPELVLMLDLVAIAQRRLDEHPEDAEEILAELNDQFPWMDKPVNITGEVFGPRRNEEGVIEDALVSYIDEEVVSKGFMVINRPINVDGMEPILRPTICYIFITDTELEELSENGLLLGKRLFHAVGYINAVHVEPLEASIQHYANIVREYAHEYMVQIDKIVAESSTKEQMMIRLGEVSITPPKNAVELEGMRALIEYVYHVLDIDPLLPYAIKASGTYLTNVGNTLEADDSEDDFDTDLQEQEDMTHVTDTAGSTMAVLGNIKKVLASYIPTVIGKELRTSTDLRFVYEVDLYAKDHKKDFMQKIGIPAQHIKSIYAVRGRHKSALV